MTRPTRLYHMLRESSAIYYELKCCMNGEDQKDSITGSTSVRHHDRNSIERNGSYGGLPSIRFKHEPSSAVARGIGS